MNGAGEAVKMDWISIMTSGGPFALGIDVLLLVMSVITWGIIIERWVALGKAHRESEIFLRAFWESSDFTSLYGASKKAKPSPAREVFREGFEEMARVAQVCKSKGMAPQYETIRRALARARRVEEGHLTRNMSFLAIAASAAPFIGLFGTVIGIIRAFGDIGASGSTSLAAVAPGISEALAATALGLVSAIPAVVFYNAFGNRIRRNLLLLDTFSSDFLNILERQQNDEAVKSAA